MPSHFSHVWLFVTLWTVSPQVPLSMGFSRQEYWNGLPLPPPGDLLEPGIEPTSPVSPALAGRFFTTSATCWKPVCMDFSFLFPAYCLPCPPTPYGLLLSRAPIWGPIADLSKPWAVILRFKPTPLSHSNCWCVQSVPHSPLTGIPWEHLTKLMAQSQASWCQYVSKCREIVMRSGVGSTGVEVQ